MHRWSDRPCDSPVALIAPDKFKGSLSAAAVAAALAAGLRQAGVSTLQMPLADGGDGSVEAALAAGYLGADITVAGALGRPRRARIARSGSVTLVEVANTCGLATLPAGRSWPLDASTLGFGQAVRNALLTSPSRIDLALGGSASTDGGTGLLTALGFEFHDVEGRGIRPGGRDLERIASVDISRLIRHPETEFVVASDVTNPLLGPTGAANVYGPQKGARASEIARLERGLDNLVRVMTDAGYRDAATLADSPGAGAAGGVGFATSLIGARMTSGAEHFLGLLGFDEALSAADLVITGEGCIDDQTSHGKLLSAVVERASPKPVIAVAGQTTLTPALQSSAGFAAVHTLARYTSENTSTNPGLTHSTLMTIGRRIGNDLMGAGTRARSS